MSLLARFTGTQLHEHNTTDRQTDRQTDRHTDRPSSSSNN